MGPKASQLKPGALILAAPQSAGGPGVTAKFGDVITHSSQTGWHVCIAQFGASVVVPVGGLQANHSDESFRWVVGNASFSGIGVPTSAVPSATYDQVQGGTYGGDGRILGNNTGQPSW